MDSILTSIKKLLGIEEAYTAFDADIIIHINAVFSVLTQLGVGPTTGFSIADKTTNWSSFMSNDDALKLNSVKSYMYMKIKLIFDPPSSSAVIEAYKELIHEFEWRLNVSADVTTTT